MKRRGVRKTHCKRGHDMSVHRKFDSGGTYCAKCKAEKIAARRKHPEKRLLILARERAAKNLRKYGLTDAHAVKLIEAQGGGCAICGSDEWGPRGPNIDHCHGKGHVRGILCMACNIGIGHFKDNPELLMSAATYLLFRAIKENDA